MVVLPVYIGTIDNPAILHVLFHIIQYLMYPEVSSMYVDSPKSMGYIRHVKKNFFMVRTCKADENVPFGAQNTNLTFKNTKC